MDLVEKHRKWDELAKKFTIYKTIEDWETCPANVLANKIKKLDVYVSNLLGIIRLAKKIDQGPNESFEDIIYKLYLKFYAKGVQQPYIPGKTPFTWSVDITKWRETPGGISIGKKKQVNSTTYIVRLNRQWFDYFVNWLVTTLQQMQARLDASREETKKKDKDRANEEIQCPCGGHYQKSNKSKHVQTEKHQDYLESLEN